MKAELKNLHRFKSYGQNKKNPKLGPFPLYFWPKNDHSEVGTSNWSSELIFIFWESLEQGEWE